MKRRKLYAKEKTIRANKSRSHVQAERDKKPSARGRVYEIPIKRDANRGGGSKRETAHRLDEYRPQNRAELTQLILGQYGTFRAAAAELGISAATLNTTLTGKRQSWATREKLCRIYNLTMSVFEA